jgi:sec-independent protein translocase protein TatA
MFNSIGPLELGIVLLIVLLIFGPKRLPGLGKQLGSGMREFKDGITGKSKSDGDHDDDDAKPELTSSSAEQAFGETNKPTTSVAAEDAERR